MTATRRPAAVAIEMALALPFLAAAVAMAVDFARVLQATQVLQSAADVAAAAATGNTWVPAAAGAPADAAQAAACAEAATLTPPLRTDQVGVATSGPVVTVTVDYDFPLVTAFLVPEGTVHLRRSVTARTAPTPGN